MKEVRDNEPDDKNIETPKDGELVDVREMSQGCDRGECNVVTFFTQSILKVVTVQFI